MGLSAPATPDLLRNPGVRDGAGRAWGNWATAAVGAWDSGAARNRPGVEEMACSEGWSVNWGEPPAPGVESQQPLQQASSQLDHRGANRQLDGLQPFAIASIFK